MKSDQFFGELDLEKSKNRRLQWALGGCILIILILASTVRAQVGKERNAFVPPEISKPFWISSEDASPEYFEQMGQYINGLPLNVTPETADMACKQYLTYVLPKDRDKFKKKCDIDTARIKRDSASQMFSVRDVKTDAKHRRVAFTGTMTTLIADKTFKNTEAYLIEFAHSDGRFYVTNHEKVDANDPFGIKKQASN
jgi:conjugal transfer pilus assembly protein TraE